MNFPVVLVYFFKSVDLLLTYARARVYVCKYKSEELHIFIHLISSVDQITNRAKHMIQGPHNI